MNIINDVYQRIVSSLPENLSQMPMLFIITMSVVFYGTIIWMFYKILAKKEIIKIDLDKYNNSENESSRKIGAVLLYILEFLILTPVLITIWFFVFVILLLFLAQDHSGQSLLIIAASFVAATRICSYYNEDLSNDLAKMFPFTLLGIAVSNASFFNFTETISRFQEIGTLLSSTLYYIIFIFTIEIILRIFTIFNKNTKENV